MNDLEMYAPFKELDRDPNPATADVFEELAERGRFDEAGYELSQADWDDARTQ